jgi:hypothetical protein
VPTAWEVSIYRGQGNRSLSEAQAAAIALYSMYYNLGRIHRTLRVTPAMAAGVTNRLLDVSDLVALLIDSESEKAA